MFYGKIIRKYINLTWLLLHTPILRFILFDFIFIIPTRYKQSISFHTVTRFIVYRNRLMNKGCFTELT